MLQSSYKYLKKYILKVQIPETQIYDSVHETSIEILMNNKHYLKLKFFNVHSLISFQKISFLNTNYINLDFICFTTRYLHYDVRHKTFNS